jgi:hypothetical protein
MKTSRTRRNTLVVLFAGIANVILLALFAVVVLVGVFFAWTALGQGAFARPIPDFTGWSQLPPEKQTVGARSFYPTVNPNVTPEALGPDAIPTIASREIPANLPHRAAGAGTIINGGIAPLPATAYDVSNYWVATTGTEKFAVYAGATHVNGPTQGFVLVIYKTLNDNDSRPSNMVMTPTGTGALTIVDVTGMTLKLQSDQGVTYYFDVNAGKFVSH